MDRPSPQRRAVRSAPDRWEPRAALGSGLVAGLVFLLLELVVLLPLEGLDASWAPARRVAALVLGPEVLPPPASADLGVVAVALGVHFALALLYTLLLSALLGTARPARAAGAGLLFGLGLYLVNFHLFTVVFPWFAAARGWGTALGHAVFGVLAGHRYVVRAATVAARRTAATPASPTTPHGAPGRPAPV